MDLDPLNVSRTATLPADIDDLVEASLLEEFRAIRRLRDDWQDGKNRFSATGEPLFEARMGRRLVGVCGLNRDPYLPDATVGRLRHLYVHPDFRRRGVGRLLVGAVLEQARGTFHQLRLRTDRADADQLYVALGFEKNLHARDFTHAIALPSVAV